ncbi:sulfotransferase [Streptomyces alanosinicus]|uniref:Sulfotransferase family protein n=1 Tax=Streptomyces alanosinicus TaxID=68171 RepID=A0A918YI02_9ACTN|nr:sulfotransferase [Streptomyces alanosinicus]GHE02829.1 hypothetical protein GCM10010339_27550 [Streptomyces alanosinicus]
MTATGSGGVRTLDRDFSADSGRVVDLVFRTVGERTSDLALSLAIRHIRPRRVHVVENVRPFPRALERMLAIDHDGASHVVYVDADCLILEDLRPFLDANGLAYVDTYVQDRFRGRIHCGVHITRTDLVRRMRRVRMPYGTSHAAVVRPEAYCRNEARRGLQLDVQLKGFYILHDHFQYFADIFAKYALRELRSRGELSRLRLESAMQRWDGSSDFTVARAAVHHSRRSLALGATPRQYEAYVHALPRTAQRETATMGLPVRPDLTMEQVQRAIAADPALARPRPRPKVFVLGFPGTGIRSVVDALHELGFDLPHHPFDHGTLAAVRRGDASFPLLRHYDGLAGVLPLVFLAQLDAGHPGARFILTVRAKETWLSTLRRRGTPGCPPDAPPREHAVHREVTDLLQDAVLSSTDTGPEGLSRAYDEQVARVRAHFARRPQDLLVLDVGGGEGWAELASFLDAVHYPHQPSSLSAPD